MADLTPWPDIHLVLQELLDDFTVGPIIGPRLEPGFEQSLPLVCVRKVGGTVDTNKITDYPRVAVDVYGPDYATAVEISEGIRQRLLSGPHRTSHGRLDRCDVESSPFEIPWPNRDIRYLTATYRLSTRR